MSSKSEQARGGMHAWINEWTNVSVLNHKLISQI